MGLGPRVTAATPETRKDHPHVVALPPLIYVAFLILGLILEFFWRTPIRAAPVRVTVGPLLIIAGLLLGVRAVREFQRAGTNFEVYRPATALVATGPYRWTRNPIYLGFAVAYVGAALLAASQWVLGLLVPLLVVVHYGVILREEQYLTAKFGTAYHRYQASVRRWV